MHPIMLSELLASYHREQSENDKKLARMRRFEMHDYAQVHVVRARPVAKSAASSIVTKIAGWLDHMRPARAS